MIPPWDWKAFREQLQRQLSDSGKAELPGVKDLGWIDDYIKEALEDALGRPMPKKPPEKKDPVPSEPAKPSRVSQQSGGIHRIHDEVIERKHTLIIRLHIPDGVNPRRVRLSIHPYQLRWRILPDTSYRLLTLPAAVDPASAKALCRNQTMEIRVKKKPSPTDYYEIRPRFKED